MFDFSVISMILRMGTQICPSRFHNLGNWIPILKSDTSTNLGLNSLLFYIKIILLRKGKNFNPFS